MNLPPLLLLSMRRTARVAAWLLALAVAGFAVAASVMFFWVLPNIADHRDTVAGLMSRALGQRVTLEGVSGQWRQLRPEFQLHGMRIHDAQGEAALALPRFEARFSWRSLLFLEPRFSRIELAGLSLDIHRAQDGRLTVGGVAIDPADPEGGLTNWLLRQGSVHIAGASLTWRDAQRGTPDLVLNDVDLVLENVRRRHSLRGELTPPVSLARPLRFDAHWQASDPGDRRTWNGRVTLESAGVALSQLQQWVALPVQLDAGLGAVNLNIDVKAGVVQAIGAGVGLRGLRVRLGETQPALQLDQARGQMVWQRQGRAHRFSLRNFMLAQSGQPALGPFDAGWRGGEGRHEISVSRIDLAGWQPVLASLPLDVALAERLIALEPRGRLDLLRLAWRGPSPTLDDFSVEARFSKIALNAVDTQPGVANVSGLIKGDTQGGHVELTGRHLAIDLPAVMRERLLQFDEFHAKGGWQKRTHGYRLALAEVQLANPDLAGSLRGHYDWMAGSLGVADLEARLTRADGRAIWRYFPHSVGHDTVNWTRTAVQAGRAEHVRFRLRGDLAHFPFDQAKGEFRVEAAIKDAVIEYAADWPAMQDVDARLVFSGKSMEVTSSRARIYDVALNRVRGVIPDLIHHEEVLNIVGEAQGNARDFVRFANFSPVGERLRGLTDTLDASGDMKLTLRLTVPLRHSRDTTLAGRLSFLGGTIFPAGQPRIEAVQGDISFTESVLAANNLTARFLGGALRVDAQTHDGRVRVTAQGRAAATGLAPWLGESLGSRLSGQADWRGQIDFEAAGERVRVESDLVGLVSRLPAPLNKSAQQPLPLLLTVQSVGGQTQNELRLGRLLGASWRMGSEARFERGEVRFGGPATLPAEQGLRLAGSGRGLDLGGWMNLFPDARPGNGMALSGMDIGFEAFDLMGRRFHDVRLLGRIRNGLLHTQVTAQGVAGAVVYRPGQVARVSGQFGLLTLPPVRDGGGQGPSLVSASAFPVLDLKVEDFRLEARPLGRLEAVARGTPRGLAIDTLRLAHADSVFEMRGFWRDAGKGETRADLKLAVLDADRFLARYGFADTLRRGAADISGEASWEGSPADFAFSTLAGRLDFKAKGGQFLKVEPGAGKLLGVLSLQSLPRRLNFDFRDIFNSGYAFDDIDATLSIAGGVVSSTDFQMRGPAAKVTMSGHADLNRESVALRVKVIPKLSESVAVAGALLGGPLAGVGVLAAQKLLRDPVEEAISQEYLITGGWAAPDVKRLPKLRAESEATEP